MKGGGLLELISFIPHETLIVTVRMFVAAILAGFVGLEREFKQHPAGLRTHLLVGVVSCLMMILSIYGFEAYVNMHENVRFDPARIPSYVISGIGFLGAGTIIVHGQKVRGLTTAASIWVVAGIGLVVGAGMYYEAMLATVVVVMSLFLLNKIEPIYVKKENRHLLIIYGKSELTLEEVTNILVKSFIDVDKKSVDKLKNEDTFIRKYTLYCQYSRNKQMTRVIDHFMSHEHVIKVETAIDV